jgi:hypothetical protein
MRGALGVNTPADGEWLPSESLEAGQPLSVRRQQLLEAAAPQPHSESSDQADGLPARRLTQPALCHGLNAAAEGGGFGTLGGELELLAGA